MKCQKSLHEKLLKIEMMGVHLKQESHGLARIKDVFSILCPSLYSTQCFHCYNYE